MTEHVSRSERKILFISKILNENLDGKCSKTEKKFA
jgi:hypothetical protein